MLSNYEQMSKRAIVFELLNKSHNRKLFDCGISPLNDYLKTRSGQELRRNISFPYILRFEKETQVMGYYTLSATAISVSELPKKYSKLTHYQIVPAVLIRRLALDKSLQGLGYGQFLLVDALRRIFQSKDFAIMMVVVDPKDQSAINFYQKFGFMFLGGEEDRMYLPYQTIALHISV